MRKVLHYAGVVNAYIGSHPNVHDAGGEFLEGFTERGSEAGLDSASGSAANRKGLFLVVRLSEVGLIGEKGTKVPNASIAEISVEVELLLTFKFEFTRSARVSLHIWCCYCYYRFCCCCQNAADADADA